VGPHAPEIVVAHDAERERNREPHARHLKAQANSTNAAPHDVRVTCPSSNIAAKTSATEQNLARSTSMLSLAPRGILILPERSGRRGLVYPQISPSGRNTPRKRPRGAPAWRDGGRAPTATSRELSPLRPFEAPPPPPGVRRARGRIGARPP